ncbi:Potassium voltage-gated channel subfamily A member 10 [Mizuhopecten yessoensis]|uniref:Potassium voltage-gated channel subfamily A member 10 n=1 Tax=Mizuhopecten yessoensis TaxID=6573 RepID=A0A210PM25_MIZYE|nr:Potassium voltage-gated channel subfamily A member 10 [Mizuhopecten yessoensis]
MEGQQKVCILQVGADHFEIAMDSVFRTFGSKIEMFLDTTSGTDTYTKYVIRRPKDSTMAFIEFCYTGQLHIPQNVCKGEFNTELKFWGLRSRLLEKCCFHKLSAFLNDQKKLEEFENMYTRLGGSSAEYRRHRSVKERMWGIVNCDRMSVCSKMYFYVSTTFVLLVIAILTMNSIDDVNETRQQNMSSQPDVNIATQSSVPLVIIDPPTGTAQGFKTPLDFETESEEPTQKKKSMIIEVHCNPCSYFDSGNAALYPNERSTDLKVEHTDVHLHIPKCCKPNIIEISPVESDKSAEYTQYDGVSYVDIPSIAIATLPDNDHTMNQTNDSNRTRQHPPRSGSNDTSNPIAADQNISLTNISINITEIISSDMIRAKVIEKMIDVIEDTISVTKDKLSSLVKLSNSSYFEHKLFQYVEYATMTFFTVDFFLRLITCPNKKEFFRGILNWLDLVLLIGAFARILMELSLQFKETMTLMYDFLLCVQIFRVFRLFRAIEQVKAFQVLRYSLVIGLKDICVLVMYVLVSICIFSNFIYFVEKKSDFPSIPAAWWWSIVTMTTVGYGDMAPKTMLGKLIGSLCALSGVVLFSLIIPVFVSTFLTVYDYANGSKDEGNQSLLPRVSPSKRTASLCNNELVCFAGKCVTSDSNLGTLFYKHQDRKSVSSVEVQCSLHQGNARNSDEKPDNGNHQEKPILITTKF